MTEISTDELKARMPGWEKKLDLIATRQSSLEKRFDGLDIKLESVVSETDRLSKVINGEGSSLTRAVDRLSIMIDGDKHLRVKGLAKQIDEMEINLDKLVTERNRFRWLIAGFSIQAAAFIVLLYRFGNFVLAYIQTGGTIP